MSFIAYAYFCKNLTFCVYAGFFRKSYIKKNEYMDLIFVCIESIVLILVVLEAKDSLKNGAK